MEALLGLLVISVGTSFNLLLWSSLLPPELPQLLLEVFIEATVVIALANYSLVLLNVIFMAAAIRKDLTDTPN